MPRNNVLLATVGSSGDVNPFVAIGRELARRGHRVTLVTNAYFESLGRRAGLDFLPLGQAEDYERIVEDPALWDPKLGFRVFARRVLIPALGPLYEVIRDHLDTTSIVVAQGHALGARLAHEKHGIPLVTVQLQPVAFRSVLRCAGLPPLDGVRDPTSLVPEVARDPCALYTRKPRAACDRSDPR